MTDTLKQYYDDSFFVGQADASRASATVVVPIVNEIVQPCSVLDVGCGVGGWLAEWQSNGVGDVCGVDGDYVDRAGLQIDPALFMPTDLEKPFSLGRRFDLAQCLEVAEHLDAASASTLVQSLAQHSDTVLFGAAIPGQGGAHHVNEQWPSYWVEMFAREGFRAFDVVRPLIWDDTRVQVWYRQNMLLLSRVREFTVSSKVLDLVHPGLWSDHAPTHLWVDHEPTLRQIAEYLPNAVVTAARSRLNRVRGRRPWRSPS
jgi:SAM-dependent methyltransferase